MSEPPNKMAVLGVGITPTSYEGVVNQIDSWISQRSRGQDVSARYVCVTSVHGIITAQKNPEFRAILNKADIVTPDGMPAVWALRTAGRPEQQRVYGPTLTLALCLQASRRGFRVFLYGGRPEVLPALQSRLEASHPGLVICGSYSPPFRPLTKEEDLYVHRLICQADPDIIFVGISTPKQEQWMFDHLNSFPGAVMVGVGAAFDFHAGRVRQAPLWMQRAGLEWLFRLMSEPTRLWRRYLLETPQFIPYWMLERLGLYRSPQ